MAYDGLGNAEAGVVFGSPVIPLQPAYAVAQPMDDEGPMAHVPMAGHAANDPCRSGSCGEDVFGY